MKLENEPAFEFEVPAFSLGSKGRVHAGGQGLPFGPELMLTPNWPF